MYVHAFKLRSLKHMWVQQRRRYTQDGRRETLAPSHEGAPGGALPMEAPLTEGGALGLQDPQAWARRHVARWTSPRRPLLSPMHCGPWWRGAASSS